MDDGLSVRPEVQAGSLLEHLLLASGGLDEFLGGLVEAAAPALSGGHLEILASVILLRPRTKATIAGTSQTARRLADIQCRFDDGPCMKAATTGSAVGVEDSGVDATFPLYSSAALQKGIRSALSVPIRLDGPEKAVVTYYSRQPGAFPQEKVELAERFAGEASTPLRLAIRLARLTDRAEHLAAAMESRTTIDLAAGVIMSQNRCSQDEAIEILRAASTARNMKLRDLALNVLTSTVDAPVTTHFD
ncbi:GAF and ANTAR domain-containing protein [Arthrobacter burdickii]|uniref:GAF and ANTAR domain-containing protein n=1 Tax=Arthrobacter burdickii TaxID=3035920 RepID=A0ABT8K4N1_9MICC|nr:GAF and ANTAR domain-containing protein [Arthrobacter burdickii]MDN4612408.1 GAF and ANTAR domain-containing protein [Arthrobacter burdickii]